MEKPFLLALLWLYDLQIKDQQRGILPLVQGYLRNFVYQFFLCLRPFFPVQGFCDLSLI